ncbi:MAG TPA: UbiD family decarboxylase, partial [Geobacteraceae bacterium]|nr:UbiD family decarboxylase [Geobacteraceae bacterium]
MAWQDLREFLDRLEQTGQLHRIGAEVDPMLEIAEITDRVSKSPGGGRALLFERVRGSRFPAVTNIFGSERRVCAALGVDELPQLTRRMAELLQNVNAVTEEDAGAALASNTDFARFGPAVVAQGACQEVVEDAPDLSAYPIPKSWPGDGWPACNGRFITLPLIFTRDPDTGVANCGMYLVQVFSSRSAGIRWRPGSGGAGHLTKYRARGERMPVAIALGGDPAAAFSAMLPLPAAVDEMQFAGFLRGKQVEVVQCRTSGIMVPANAELVIEGYIDPCELGSGGEFGNHTGFYAPPQELPVMHVDCITRRRDPVFPATVVGPPPMEDCHMARAAERLMLPFTRLELPEIVEINLPLEGIFHGAAIVSIDKRAPGQGRLVMERLWAKGWLSGSRLLVVVDGDVDVCDLSRVFWKVLNSSNWTR